MSRIKDYLILKQSAEPGQNIYKDKKGNLYLSDSPLRKSDVVIEMLSSQLELSFEDSKERQPQHHSVFSFKLNVTRKKEFSLDLEENENEEEKRDWFEKKLQSLCSILPKKYREEFLGDLHEIRNSMKMVGHNKWWINLVSFLKYVPLVIATMKIKLSDFLDPEQKTKEK